MFLAPLLFPVLGGIAFLGAVWTLLFVILRSHAVDLRTEDRELEAKTQFITKWQKGRVGKGSRESDVQVIRPKEQPTASNPDKADEVRSA